MFSNDEIERYARHLVLHQVGGQGQQALRQVDVTLIGLGGLGGVAALYLAAAGVGRLQLVDGDVIGLSNLQRQVAFCTDDIDKPKAQVLADRVQALNPHVDVVVHDQHFTDTLPDTDLVLDGTDDFDVRFAINKACISAKTPLISGALGPWMGQVGIFAPHLGASCYQCFVPQTPPDAQACETHGIVGGLAGMVASLMATEAVKWIANAGQPLLGRVWVYDALSATGRTTTVAKDPECPVCSHLPGSD